jgi:hypothetical protein
MNVVNRLHIFNPRVDVYTERRYDFYLEKDRRISYFAPGKDRELLKYSTSIKYVILLGGMNDLSLPVCRLPGQIEHLEWRLSGFGINSDQQDAPFSVNYWKKVFPLIRDCLNIYICLKGYCFVMIKRLMLVCNER